MLHADFIRKLGSEIRLQTGNLMMATPQYSTKMHLHSDLLHISYTSKGRGYCFVNNKKYVLTPGAIHLVFPNEPHKYAAEPSNPYTVYFLHITWLCEAPDIERILKVKKKHILASMFKDITDLCWNIHSDTAEIRKAALLCNIISELIDLSDKGNIGVQKMKNSEQTNRKFTGVLSMLGGPPFSFPGIDWLASSMGMSRRSFTAFFLKNTGMSAMDYFMRNKMIYAQNLMDSNEFSLKEIAFQCGYSNPQNFQRAYKAYFKAD